TCKIHLKLPAAMGFCTPESRSYGPRSLCADLGRTVTYCSWLIVQTSQKTSSKAAGHQTCGAAKLQGIWSTLRSALSMHRWHIAPRDVLHSVLVSAKRVPLPHSSAKWTCKHVRLARCALILLLKQKLAEKRRFLIPLAVCHAAGFGH